MGTYHIAVAYTSGDANFAASPLSNLVTLVVNPYAFSDTIGNDSQTYGTAANLAADLPATIATGVNGQNLTITYASTGDSAART